MVTIGSDVLTINSVVLGTVHMYHNKMPKAKLLELIEVNFEESEILGALTCLNQAVGDDPPQGRQTSVNRTAAQAYAMDLHDTMAKLISENKMPVIVVSSDQLSRVPTSKKKMDNSEVVTVNCRLEALETMMKTVATAVNKLGDKPSFGDVLGARPKIVVGTAAGPAAVPTGGPAPEAAGTLGGGGASQGDKVRGRSPSVKRGYNEVAKDTPNNGEVPFQPAGGRKRQPRKMTYGTNRVNVDGAEAAPIDVFVGNTNPRATEDVIKRVLLKCADNMPEKPKLDILEVKLLTNPERDPNPRFKSWMVRVPYACKELMDNDSFYPNGWSHRKYFPKRMQQQQDRNTTIFQNTVHLLYQDLEKKTKMLEDQRVG